MPERIYRRCGDFLQSLVVLCLRVIVFAVLVLLVRSCSSEGEAVEHTSRLSTEKFDRVLI